jgi:hypothetical protein
MLVKHTPGSSAESSRNIHVLQVVGSIKERAGGLAGNWALDDGQSSLPSLLLAPKTEAN